MGQRSHAHAHPSPRYGEETLSAFFFNGNVPFDAMTELCGNARGAVRHHGEGFLLFCAICYAFHPKDSHRKSSLNPESVVDIPLPEPQLRKEAA